MTGGILSGMPNLLGKNAKSKLGVALKQQLRDIADRFKKVQAPNLYPLERMQKVHEAAKKAAKSH